MYIYTHAVDKFSKNLRATIRFQVSQRWREGSQPHTDEPQVFGATVLTLVATATWRTGLVQPRPKTQRRLHYKHTHGDKIFSSITSSSLASSSAFKQKGKLRIKF